MRIWGKLWGLIGLRANIVETTLCLLLARAFLRILLGPLGFASWREILLYSSIFYQTGASSILPGSLGFASSVEDAKDLCTDLSHYSYSSYLSIGLNCAAATTMLKPDDQSLKFISCWSCIVQIDHDQVLVRNRKEVLWKSDWWKTGVSFVESHVSYLAI